MMKVQKSLVVLYKSTARSRILLIQENSLKGLVVGAYSNNKLVKLTLLTKYCYFGGWAPPFIS